MDLGLAATRPTLACRYTDLDTPVLLSGVQALLRVLLEQARLDRAAGLRTAGLVSGYRGSPLGGVDRELWRQQALLSAQDIRFQPGLNEDLAATMLWGVQQLDTFPGRRVDGVFGMWYGKGPGVDRSADALRSANMIGTSAQGGVLAVSGDDHAAQSSTFPHQTDQVFEAVMIPVLNPADVGDILDLGLAGLALSRFTGVWVALKTIAETAEQSSVVTVPRQRAFVRPSIVLPPHGLNFDRTLHWPAARAESERRMVDERLPAVGAWARANRLDRVVAGPADASIGIVTTGKAHHDLMHALGKLGLQGSPHIAVYKVAMSWPLETDGARDFARGKRLLLVVEEKRAFVETQLRSALYNLPADARPPVAGKTDLDGAPLLPATLELSPEIVAPALARLLRCLGIDVPDPPPSAPISRPDGLLTRAPTFCAGCPHNTSTVLPDGSHAMAGIGCHFMALSTTDATRTFSHMGGEGVGWIGMAPYTETLHMFANMGDGTYQHSGILAIRQAVVAKARITYKILFNDAVAMTGGQPNEGGLSVVDIARQVVAEGVTLLAVVAEDAAHLPPETLLPPGTLRDTRDNLDRVQRRLRDHAGVSVLIYDQVCATEKRRRRKRGTMAPARTHVAINPRVCENCGDCTVQSNCIAIEPVETEYGRKRRISPTSCNADLSCLKGFCPSFVTTTEQPAPDPHPILAREAELLQHVPEPPGRTLCTPWRGLFAGIGGGGIVTCGAIVAMAAHLEGRRVSTLDFTGLAQKNGAVVSHVQIADRDLDVVRIPYGEADLMLATDLVVGASGGVLERCRAGGSVVGNLDLQVNAEFAQHQDLRMDSALHRRAITRAIGAGEFRFLRGTALAERLFGNAQAMNLLLLGVAWQLGLVPIGISALLQAVELNGTAVEVNSRAFRWGRILTLNPELADTILSDDIAAPLGLEALVEQRAAELTRYQNAAYAARYRALVARAFSCEAAVAGEPGRLTRAVAEGWFRALAYKDEYEVARLHVEAGYGPATSFHVAPPVWTRRDKATGRRRKVALPGRIALPLFRVLRHGKALRGTWLDPFGWQSDRRLERRTIRDYAADFSFALGRLRTDNLTAACELAELPLHIRGFGPIKTANWQATQATRMALLQRLGLTE